MKSNQLDLRKIALSQGKSEQPVRPAWPSWQKAWGLRKTGGAKTVLSEGKVALATLKEEKQFAAGRIWSGDGGCLRKSSQAGFTLPELLVVMITSGFFVSLLLFFMISFWRYGLLLEADLDTLVTRLNAGDYLRENINPASGLIIQNSIADANPNSPDTTISPVNYWLPIHAIPGTIPVGATGTTTPLIYFKRPTITTTNTVAFNGTQPYEDEFVLYLDGTTKQLMSRTLANPSVANNKLKTSCPAANVTITCPADKIVASDISSIAMRYFSKTGNLIDYTSSYDTVTNTYTGPDFPVTEVVEFNLNLTKKPYFQTSNATFNSTVIRIAIRS